MDTTIKQRKRKLNAKGKRKRRRRIIKRILRILILLLPVILLCMIGSCAKKMLTKDAETEKKPSLKSTATIISAGDVIMHGPFLKSNHYLAEDGTYNYNSIFNFVKDTYGAADFSVVNLENTISEGDYTSYPLFRGPAAMATALSENGVDMCLLGNNHIYDNSNEGLMQTQDAMDENSLLYTGISRTAEDAKYKIVDINGIKVGIFNYTHESEKDANGQRTINSLTVTEEDLSLINTFDYNELDVFYEEISDGLAAMAEQNVEYTIAYLHWGTEYQLTENDHQMKIAQKLCDMGIDALIGGHPHVIQPVDLLTSTTDDHQMLCVYSVGNHLTNQHKGRISQSPDGHTEDGLMVKLTLDRSEEGVISLTDVGFIPTWTYRTEGVDDDGNPEFYIFPLDDSETVISKAKETVNLDIETQVSDSLNRTDEIIGEGVEKVKQALPISDKKSTE